MGHKTLRIVYWVATLLFVVPQVWSAFQMLTQAPRMAATLHHLGYPTYFMVSLGVVKLLGAAVILLGLWPDLKEWAYAGYTFDTVGAFVSHVSAGDSLGTALVPLLFLAVQLVSYVSWRRLGKPQLMAATTRSSLPGARARHSGAALEAR
ncbi:MAG TPA: DoxX family protein [Polyangiales bacterium]|nr:DoxX family protein [Polyangiales bacterium]